MEKENKRLIEKMMGFSKLARQQGVLALEHEIKNERDFFLKVALGLAVEGIDPETVSSVLRVIAKTENPAGLKSSDRLMIIQGIDCIQRGEIPLFDTEVENDEQNG